MDKNQGYEIIKAVMLENGRGFVLGHHPPRPRPMSHGLAMMTRTASGSMNGGITAATVPLWNRTLRRGCRSTSAFTMSVSSRPRLPAFTSITPPSAPWTLGHSPSRPATPRMKSSTTISASRLKNGSFLAWGHLTYTRPLTKRQASDYELRPAPDNPDRPRSIREQMKTAAKQAEADRGQSAPKKKCP